MKGALRSVSCDCCVLSRRCVCEELITAQRSSTCCGVSECDSGPHTEGLDTLGLSSHEKKYTFIKVRYIRL